MSTTIRILKRDKDRLEKLAKKLGANTLTDAFRAALEAAERETEIFRGDTEAVAEALRFAKPVAKRISENVDEELAKVIE